MLPLPATLSDRMLEAMLYAGHGPQRGSRRKAEPDLDARPSRAARAGRHTDAVVRGLSQAEPDGYGYSRWSAHYRG